MAIAYSQANPIVYATGIRTDSSPHCRADIDAALLIAGWVHTTNTISNGFEYSLTSPQGLGALCHIFDSNTAGTGNQLTIQFLGTAGTNTGYPHVLSCLSTGTAYAPGYSVIAGPCQMFLFLPGVGFFNPSEGGHAPNSVAGGIPFLPTSTNVDCVAQAQTPLPTELWWSCGADGGDTDFRVQNYCTYAFSYSKNNISYVPSAFGSDDPNALRIFPLVQTNANTSAAILMVPVLYDTSPGVPLLIDTLVGWQNQVQGQIWDSFIMTKPMPLDDIQTYTETFGETSWSNYANAPTGWQHNGNGTEIYALYLLFNYTPTALSNYAY
jgi:hypothetical protein